MQLIQILLPVLNNQEHAFAESQIAAIRDELVARFGGITAFSRTPAEGVWATGGGNVRDDIILVEVMVETLDRAWWKRFQGKLEEALAQKSIVVRATAIECL